MSHPADTPRPPYWAVIFSSRRSGSDGDYDATAARMLELAEAQPGFLGIESTRGGADGITVSYWESEEAIAAFRELFEHRVAQRRGRESWYAAYTLRVARVERAYDFARDAGAAPPGPGSPVRVLRDYDAAFADPPRFAAGDTVRVERRESEWDGWLWIERGDGPGAYAPEDFLEHDGERGTLRRDYDPRELSVSAGERLHARELAAGWAWCRRDRDGAEGWVPLDYVEHAGRDT